MKLIAHRGLINGPDKKLENQPNQILLSLEKGYDCEIDLWKIYDRFYLGHDHPEHRVEQSFLLQSNLWIHAKNLDALYWLSRTDLTYFWHQNDDHIITSNGYIWTFPEKTLTDRSVRLMPEWKDPNFETIKKFPCYGVCSDFVEKIRTLL